MNFRSQKSVKTAILLFGLTSLGGCSVLGGFWQHTKQFSQSKIAYIGTLLRPAPKQVVVFEPTRTETSPKTRNFMQKYNMPVSNNTPPTGYAPTRYAPTRYAMTHTIEEGVHVYRPDGRVRHFIKTPTQAIARPQITTISRTNDNPRLHLRPASDPYLVHRPQPADPIQELAGAAQTQDMPDLSYVKIGGGADMADWQNCQRENGQYIRPMGEGYQINPGFDLCMRNKGYLTEKEAIKVLQIKH